MADELVGEKKHQAPILRAPVNLGAGLEFRARRAGPAKPEFGYSTAPWIYSFHGDIMAEREVVFVTYGRFDTIFRFDESL